MQRQDGGKVISKSSDEFYHLIAESGPSHRSSPQASRAELGRDDPGKAGRDRQNLPGVGSSDKFYHLVVQRQMQQATQPAEHAGQTHSQTGGGLGLRSPRRPRVKPREIANLVRRRH